ncbi:hypothetical protein V8C44DRAFT_314419 [Trichoderma aethiopicum]
MGGGVEKEGRVKTVNMHRASPVLPGVLLTWLAAVGSPIAGDKIQAKGGRRWRLGGAPPLFPPCRWLLVAFISGAVFLSTTQ